MKTLYKAVFIQWSCVCVLSRATPPTRGATAACDKQGAQWELNLLVTSIFFDCLTSTCIPHGRRVGETHSIHSDDTSRAADQWIVTPCRWRHSVNVNAKQLWIIDLSPQIQRLNMTHLRWRQTCCLRIRAAPCCLQVFLITQNDVYSKRGWRQAQHLADIFWRRWVAEYIPTLQLLQKWTDDQLCVKIADKILVSEELYRGEWPLERVIDV